LDGFLAQIEALRCLCSAHPLHISQHEDCVVISGKLSTAASMTILIVRVSTSCSGDGDLDSRRTWSSVDSVSPSLHTSRLLWRRLASPSCTAILVSQFENLARPAN